MSEARLDPLARIDATAEAISGLREICASDEPLDDVLARVAATAAGSLPDADAVTITMLTEGTPRTAAFTDERAALLDHCQYGLGAGPCLHCAEHQRAVRIEIVEHSEQWAVFHEAAHVAGVRACLSVPLMIGGPGQQESIGSLNVYSFAASAFDPYDEKLMALFTEAAGAAVTNARAWEQSRTKVAQLEEALTSRAEIDQAKGVVMALHQCSAEDAFAKLVEQSQHHNKKLRDVARDLLASVR